MEDSLEDHHFRYCFRKVLNHLGNRRQPRYRTCQTCPPVSTPCVAISHAHSGTTPATEDGKWSIRLWETWQEKMVSGYFRVIIDTSGQKNKLELNFHGSLRIEWWQVKLWGLNYYGILWEFSCGCRISKKEHSEKKCSWTNTTVLLDIHENLVKSNKFWLIEVNLLVKSTKCSDLVKATKKFDWINQTFCFLN